jgi:ankyrin repeat protein
MRGHQEETPLHHAAWGGHTEVVKLLIQYGADVNEKNVRALWYRIVMLLELM